MAMNIHLPVDRELMNGRAGNQVATENMEKKGHSFVRPENYTLDDAVALPDVKTNLSRLKSGELKGLRYGHDYRYLHNPSHICFTDEGKRKKVLALFYSPTATHHFSRRKAIRETYGNSSNWGNCGDRGLMYTVFLLGATSNESLQRKIDLEASQHRDIVQEGFLDTYLNLTLKAVMGLKWVINYCNHAKFAVKIDDDAMMNQKRFYDKFLTDLPLTGVAAGTVWVNAKPVRREGSKFFISKEEYPLHSFPNYLNGLAYVLSLDVVREVYAFALTTTKFKWEDVFVGMCLQKAGVQLRNINNMDLYGLRGKNYEARVEEVHSHIFITDLNVTEMIWVWKIGHI
ncbi:beta-1,3-galactosyltransferase 5-like [Lytechinus variegatus]|uniref:beta-1,3-galactosyltransferase 5-like n=1 Tax=Lytechinus variegatus TaxID=7654 RepID=UPI001BB1CEFE|nr:beta-1,3-galactosyltransferase 5-like [Lytechinus variegatus]